MAIQTLNGNLIQNSMGGNIICQGPMLTFSPFVTDSHTWQKPREYWFDSPVYNDDGSISHYQSNRTGQKDNHSFNVGASLTFSMPLDGSLQKRCKQAADTQIARQDQALKDSQLSWHIARLKECGNLKLKGIEFASWSPYFELCKDVVVRAKPGQVLPHRHKTPPKIILKEGDLSSRGKRSFFSGTNWGWKPSSPTSSESFFQPLQRGVLRPSRGRE